MFVDEILAELAGARWSPGAWVRFLERSTIRSWRQAVCRPRTAFEVTAEHALLFVVRPGPWPIVAGLMAATHVGLLSGDDRGLGWPNRLSLLRGNLPAMVTPPAPWTAGLALVTDWADGRLARRSGETAFGGYADAMADIAFWTWFAKHHEQNRVLRQLATAVWLAPAFAITAAYFFRGGAVEVDRPVAMRNVSVALQVAVAVRALFSAR
jgi:phosphatidylglycerophosphate synthase